MHHRPYPVSSRLIPIALAGSLGAWLMSTVGLLVALQLQSHRFQNFSPWQMLKFLAGMTARLQFLEFGAWVVITGLLIALGNQRTLTRARALAALAALAAGAGVPLGLLLLGHTLSKLWPNTTGPTDAPGVTLLLALYSLTIPWLLGRLVSRIAEPHCIIAS